MWPATAVMANNMKKSANNHLTPLLPLKNLESPESGQEMDPIVAQTCDCINQTRAGVLHDLQQSLFYGSTGGLSLILQ
jgi:hypothetical protein